MWPFLGKKAGKYIGVDIGTSSIKVVQLGKEKGRTKLENYGFLESERSFKDLYAPSRGETLGASIREVGEMLGKVVEEAGVTYKKAVMSIPPFSTFTTVIDLPQMPEKELAQAIPFEARHYIPVPVSEVSIDWSIIGTSGNKKKERASKIRVLLVAVLKEVINKYTAVATRAGLRPEILEAEAFSLARSLLGNDKSAVAIVDIGAYTTDINIIDGGFVQLCHNMEASGEELTKVLVEIKNLEPQEAEKLKREAGIKEIEESTGRAILTVVETILSEVRRIIDFYGRKQNRKIEKIILAGGSARLPGLKEYFSRELGLDVSLANPWARVVYPPILEPVLKEIGPSFAVAVGLAMREL